jgi:hypothetical protein
VLSSIRVSSIALPDRQDRGMGINQALDQDLLPPDRSDGFIDVSQPYNSTADGVDRGTRC